MQEIRPQIFIPGRAIFQLVVVAHEDLLGRQDVAVGEDAHDPSKSEEDFNMFLLM